MCTIIIQASCKPDFFQMERGCKQGNLIAPYLFIIDEQILPYMVKQNIKI